jgi:hypothetical protein
VLVDHAERGVDLAGGTVQFGPDRRGEAGQVAVMIGGRVDPVVTVHIVVGGQPVPLGTGGGLARRCRVRVRVGPDHQPVLVVRPLHRKDVFVAVQPDLRLVRAHGGSVVVARSGRQPSASSLASSPSTSTEWVR